MKKIWIIIGCMLLLSFRLIAQFTPTQGTVEYNKVEVPCYKMEVPYSADVTEDAIRKKFKELGASGKEHKGFIEFKNVTLKQVRDKEVDAYVKIDRKSKKEKDISDITMIITEPGVAPDADNGSGGAKGAGVIATAGAYGFMSSLSKSTEGYGLAMQIKDKEDAIKKADRDYDDMMKKQDEYQNKLKDLQNDINKNKDQHQKMTDELKNLKDQLAQQKGGKKD